MNCQYIKENEIHEKYILDRLKDTDKIEYLNHLKNCDSCRREFERQRFFISSVREAGKKGKKLDIALQVQELKSRKTIFDWDMVLKVAAVFFFLVITPGLVYYYQIIEPPKTSELLDADKFTDFAEVEEESPKKIVQSEQIEKKTNVTESKKLKRSEPGAGAGVETKSDKNPAILSAGAGSRAEVELFKNSDRSIKESMPLAEAAIPKSPPLANKYIPDLEKFSKPVNTKSDQEFFDDLQNLAGKSGIKKERHIQSDSFTQNKIQIAPLKTQKYQSDEKSIPRKKKNLQFATNGKSIQVSMELSSSELEKDKKSLFPKLFPVEIQKKDSLNLIMKWYINSKFITINNKDIGLFLSGENTVYVSLFENIFYKINLTPDTTMAMLIK